MTLLIRPTGDITTIYQEVLDLAALGAMRIERASHVELDELGRWWATCRPGRTRSSKSNRSGTARRP
jgi:hypothetical protein